MPTRREFLTTATAAMVTAATPLAAVRSQREIKSSLGGVIGLQLWSLRDVSPQGTARNA